MELGAGDVSHSSTCTAVCAPCIPASQAFLCIAHNRCASGALAAKHTKGAAHHGTGDRSALLLCWDRQSC